MRTTVCILGFLAVCLPALAQSTTTIGEARFDFTDPSLRPRTEAQKQLARGFLDAVAARSAEQLQALVHPDVRACMTSETSRAYQSWVHGRDLGRRIPANVNVIFVPFTDKMNFTFGAGDISFFAVRPTWMFGIEFSDNEFDARGVLIRSSGATLLKPAVEQAGRLMLVEPCLTAKGEELFRKRMESRPTEPPK